jgi:hypothetical protein
MQNKVTYLDTSVLIKIFKNISTCLLQVESFAFGHTFDATKHKDLKYPILFLELPTQYSWSSQSGNNSSRKSIQFAFQILTRVTEGQGGQSVNDETIFSFGSDIAKVEYVAEEVLSLLNRNYRLNLNANYTYTALPLTEAYEDNCYGVRVDVEMFTNFSINDCDIILDPDSDCGPISSPTPGGGNLPGKCNPACVLLIEEIENDLIELENLLTSKLEEIENEVEVINTNLGNVQNQVNNVQNQVNNVQNQVNNIQTSLNNLKEYKRVGFQAEDVIAINAYDNALASAQVTGILETELRFYDFRFTKQTTILGVIFRQFAFTTGGLPGEIKLYTSRYPASGNNFIIVPNQEIPNSTLNWNSVAVHRLLFVTPITLQPGQYFLGMRTNGGIFAGRDTRPINYLSNFSVGITVQRLGESVFLPDYSNVFTNWTPSSVNKLDWMFIVNSL